MKANLDKTMTGTVHGGGESGRAAGREREGGRKGEGEKEREREGERARARERERGGVCRMTEATDLSMRQRAVSATSSAVS